MAATAIRSSSTFSAGFPLVTAETLRDKTSGASMEETRRRFDQLSAGGKVTMPFGETFWSPGFGGLINEIRRALDDQYGSPEGWRPKG